MLLMVFAVQNPAKTREKVLAIDHEPLSYTHMAIAVDNIKLFGMVEVDRVPDCGEEVVVNEKTVKTAFVDTNYQHFGDGPAIWVIVDLSDNYEEPYIPVEDRQ